MRTRLFILQWFRASFLIVWICACLPLHSFSQELRARVTVNHSQVQTTDVSVFESLKRALEQLLNTQAWTPLKFQPQERIVCNFNITVTQYEPESGTFTCRALIQANRPVYNSSYSSVLYNNVDGDFNFVFTQFDQLAFNAETIDNQLTALMAYYAYLIIGINLDSFSPMGGEDVFQLCMTLANNAQNLNFTGWKSFDNDRNRFAIINDYLDERMKPFRELQYRYYREGLDEMASNVNRGRDNVTAALEECLQKSKDNKPLSMLPQIWTDYKRDELVNIYQGKSTPKEKEKVYEILFRMNASQSDAWNKIKE